MPASCLSRPARSGSLRWNRRVSENAGRRHGSSDAHDLDQTGSFIMLTRRGFAGFASCAICAVTGFIATDASAQAAPPAAVAGVKRKVLSQLDGPMPGYVTINMEVEIDPGVTIARHTHPG